MNINNHLSGPVQASGVAPSICRTYRKPSLANETLSELKTEEMLALMAREGRLPPELIPLWEDVKAMRASDFSMALDEVERNLKREVIMGEAERVACVLWIAHTYVYEQFRLSPRLFVTSGGPNAGKSKLLSMVADMSCGGLRLNKASEAALGRAKGKYGSSLTIALDQLDNGLDRRAPQTGSMLDRLISGADRGTKQMLTDKRSNGSFDPAQYDLFFPMALGKIGTLPSAALRSRCIVIQMHPATPEEAATLEVQAKGQADPNIRPLLVRAMKVIASEMPNRRPTMPAKLINRGADKWRPMLAIAEAAGGDWLARALAAANELESDEEEQPPHVILLSKVVSITKDWPHPVIFSEELDSALSKSGISERAAWGARPSSAKDRGNMLKLVGLKAERHWRDGKQLRGYLIADIRAQAEKYLRPDTCDA